MYADRNRHQVGRKNIKIHSCANLRIGLEFLPPIQKIKLSCEKDIIPTYMFIMNRF